MRPKRSAGNAATWQHTVIIEESVRGHAVELCSYELGQLHLLRTRSVFSIDNILCFYMHVRLKVGPVYSL